MKAASFGRFSRNFSFILKNAWLASELLCNKGCNKANICSV